MWDADDCHVVDNNNDALSSFSEDSGRGHWEGVGTMPSPAPGVTSGVVAAVDNQQDWLFFDGNIDDLLSSCPSTIVKQTKCKKISCCTIPTKYEYHQCHCGCGYKLSICTSYATSNVTEIYYKEVPVSCYRCVLCFVSTFIF